MDNALLLRALLNAMKQIFGRESCWSLYRWFLSQDLIRT
ncbi:hypothetical protein SynMVIR181_01031 [Synechococcus sp. MVIR-18-1]|nr:hypothetical protein SynMVIR181_01031 [Synechococcus sp. MVIR-18-1]